MTSGDGRGGVERIHADVDRAARRLTVLHTERLRCARGCHDCCVDDLTVFQIEADRIRRHHEALLTSGAPHPEGACAFLDHDGACRVYEHRPYVCRTQGLPLRWIDEVDGELAELRDICPLNEAGAPLEELAEEACWELGPIEERLAQAELEAGRGADGSGARQARVRLRDLFRAPASGVSRCDDE